MVGKASSRSISVNVRSVTAKRSAVGGQLLGYGDLAAMDRFAALGHPLLLSASNKIFLGRLLGLDVTQRDAASTAAAAIGALRGCRVLRVHDAPGARHAADLVAAVRSADLDGS